MSCAPTNEKGLRKIISSCCAPERERSLTSVSTVGGKFGSELAVEANEHKTLGPTDFAWRSVPWKWLENLRML
jgi:hypothetical protein